MSSKMQAEHRDRLQAELDDLQQQKESVLSEKEAQSLELRTIRADIAIEQHLLEGLKREEVEAQIARYAAIRSQSEAKLSDCQANSFIHSTELSAMHGSLPNPLNFQDSLALF